MSRFDRIAVLGAGAWGTALAYTAHRAGREVQVLAREPDVAASLSEGQGNPAYLPGVTLPAMQASTQAEDITGADAILAVVPAQFARTSFRAVGGAVAPGTPVLLCAKGIEQATLSLMTDILAEEIPGAVPAVLSGPSFAADVARGLPTAVTLACTDGVLGHDLMAAIGRDVFRPYWSEDLVGAEIGGAVKNVLAIACGMVDGLQLGKSAHAALLTRGFAEMTRLGVAMGGKAETLAGLCGLGDLVLTCSSAQSRNMSFGKALGEGRPADEVLAERRAVTEGAATAPALVQLAQRQGVDMPICTAVAEILARQITVAEAMEQLLSRPFKGET
ncbi:MAG: NAD(P)-dependent glycerol-3-phosphate dehydrogenase [Hyphomonadaceae bacterium]|nr:NAD(P)-dependent glycerol-3-phosphate dehydrogenase [Hyphomonadaceae bacterium]